MAHSEAQFSSRPTPPFTKISQFFKPRTLRADIYNWNKFCLSIFTICVFQLEECSFIFLPKQALSYFTALEIYILQVKMRYTDIETVISLICSILN
jgi:hypothetical protein